MQDWLLIVYLINKAKYIDSQSFLLLSPTKKFLLWISIESPSNTLIEHFKLFWKMHPLNLVVDSISIWLSYSRFLSPSNASQINILMQKLFLFAIFLSTLAGSITSADKRIEMIDAVFKVACQAQESQKIKYHSGIYGSYTAAIKELSVLDTKV